MEEFNLNDYIKDDDTLDYQLLYRNMTAITGFRSKQRREDWYAYVVKRFNTRNDERL